jgi:hypothetical protein
MKNKKILLAILAVALVFGMMVAGCSDPSNSTEEPPPSGPPSSVDDYSRIENTTMAPNQNRASARAGSSTQISIPDSLLPSGSSSVSRAAVSATFAVHPDDTAIAEIVSQNGTTCQVKGLLLGNARITVTVGDRSATVIMAVAPSQNLYTLPAGEIRTIGTASSESAWWTSNRPDELPSDIASFTTEPTYQLAWNWRNPSQSFGASGDPGGIDLLAYYVDPVAANRRGWVRTTYDFGGWFYKVNDDNTNKMINGVLTSGNVELKLTPEFVYDQGVPYLQITHTLTNKGSTALTGQKFGASADIMIKTRDNAPLTYMPYGALMTDAYKYGSTEYLPTLKFRIFLRNFNQNRVDEVTTLWLGTYNNQRANVYTDKRDNITITDNLDSALSFSYQNIDIPAGGSRTFVIRFTQVQ